MRRDRSAIAIGARAARLLEVVLLPTVLTACGAARQVEGTSTESAGCTNCHGDPARAGSRLNQSAPPASATGRAAGAHLAHLDAGVACASCHELPSSPSHSNRTVDVVFAGHALDGGARPMYSSADRTCSGVYCHRPSANAGGKSPAPAWTGGALGCDGCHGDPPASHAATDTRCSACHPGTVGSDNRTIDVAGGQHVDGKVEFTGGHRAGWDDPAQHGPAAKNDLAGCRTCHGPNLDGVGGTASSCDACHEQGGYPRWQSNCTFCHGTKVASYAAASLAKAAPPRGSRGETAPGDAAVGAHQKHLVGGLLGAGVACDACHAVPGDLAHLDGKPTVTFGAAATQDGAKPSWNGTTCATTYCHGATLAGGKLTAPSWTGGSTQTSCGSCHGVPPPQPQHPAATTCDGCHPGYTLSTVDASLHMNGVVDAVGKHPAGYAAKTQHGYDANRKGLAGCKSCHGTDFSGGTVGTSCNDCHEKAGWGAWQTNCTFCHGARVPTYTSANLDAAAPPVGSEGETATSARAVGAHAKHLAAGNLGPKVACATCHAVPTDLAHVTGTPVVTLTGVAAADGVKAAWNGTTCTTYCHGASLKGGSVAAPSWTGDSTQIACGACHGRPPTGHAASSTDCSKCHTGYTATTVNKTTHMNGKVDATGGHAQGYADKSQHGYEVNRTGLAKCKDCHGANLDGVGGIAQSCGDCHAQAGIQNWATNCTFCHGTRGGSTAPPVDTQGKTSGVTVGAHQAHLRTGLMNGLSCGVCHPGRSTSVVTDGAHIDGNGVSEVVLSGIAARNTSPRYSRNGTGGASCASVYCHKGRSQEWTGGKMGCNGGCHGTPPNAGHSGHLGCGECHPGYSGNSVNKATHIDGQLQATKNCTSCHGPGGDD